MSTQLKPTSATYTPKWGSATPPVAPAQPVMPPLTLSPGDAIARPRARRTLTREDIRSVKGRMRDVQGERIFDWMLTRLSKLHRDLVDPEQLAAAAARNAFPETCVACMGKFHAPGSPTSSEMWSEPPCPAIASIVESVVSEERAKHGAFLLQDPQVVFGQIELQLVFDSPSATKRMRRLKQTCPAAFNGIKQFLCGPGYHLAPPKADNHDAWNALLARLRFDWIRDNKTPLYTELSRNWKKRHTPFEQFAHFLFFRDSMPAHPTVNMLTHAQKPVLVAAMAGDTTAFVLLAKLGFTMPSDPTWQQTPFLKDMLDTRRYAVLRHLNTYFFRRQFKNPSPMALATAAPVSLSLGNSPVVAPAVSDPLLMDELARAMHYGGPIRVWEARPPKKNAATGSQSRPSPMNDPSFAATLPELTPPSGPAAPGSAKGSSWATVARKSAHGAPKTPPLDGATAPDVATPSTLPAPHPTPVPPIAQCKAKHSPMMLSTTPESAPPADAPVLPAAKSSPGKKPLSPVQKHQDPQTVPSPPPMAQGTPAKAAPKKSVAPRLPPAPELPPAGPRATGTPAQPPKTDAEGKPLRKNAWGV